MLKYLWHTGLLACALVLAPSIIHGAPGDEFWSPDFHHAGVHGTIAATVSTPNGLLIGGRFTRILTQEVNNIALLKFTDNVISEIKPLGEGLPGSVVAVGEHQGDVIAIGRFGDHHAARWDGSSWQMMGDGMGDNLPETVISYQGELYAGTFRWDGDQWLDHFIANGAINTMVVDDGVLFVGGAFTEAVGVPVEHVFAWDGVNVSQLGAGVQGAVTTATVGPDGVVVGWGGHNPGKIERWTGSAWVVEQDLGAGVESIAYLNDNLVVSNEYHYGGTWIYVVVKRIATQISGSWQTAGSFGTGLMVEHNGMLVMGHNQSVVEDIASPGIIGFDGTDFMGVFPENNGLDSGVIKMAAFGEALLATGRFQVAGGRPAEYCGVWSQIGRAHV